MGTVTVTGASYGNIFQNLGHRYWTGPMTVAMSTSYAQYGDAITPAQVGFGSVIDAMIVVGPLSATASGFWLFTFNATNNTIQVFTASGTPSATTAFVELTAGQNISATTFNAIFVGV